MKNIIVIVMAVFFVALSSSAARAHCGACGTLEGGTKGEVVSALNYDGHEAASLDEAELINETCPVMGGKVVPNTPYRVMYEEKAIGFCCPACVKEFKSDPDKYMMKLEEEVEESNEESE